MLGQIIIMSPIASFTLACHNDKEVEIFCLVVVPIKTTVILGKALKFIVRLLLELVTVLGENRIPELQDQR